MDIKQLQYFTQIYKDKSFSKAADNLFITQQGISMSMARLEEELGAKLIVRNKKKLSFTAEGMYLLKVASKIIDEFEKCQEYFEKNKYNRHNLSVLFSYGTLSVFGTDLIRKFEERNPTIKIQYVELPDKDCETSLQNGSIELGFAIGPVDDALFDSSLVYKSNYAVIVHKDNPLSTKSIIDVSDLENQPIMMMNSSFKDLSNIRPSCLREGFEPNIYFMAAEISLIYKMVNQNKCIGFTIDSLIEDFCYQDVVHLPINDPCLVWDVYLIKNKSKNLSRRASAFWNFVVNYNIN